jgi:hypothetical protein
MDLEPGDIGMAVSNLSKAKFPKFPKEVKNKDVEKAMDQAKKDFDGFVAALKALSAPQKKAKDSMWAAVAKLSDYIVDEAKDPKEISAGEKFEEEFMNLYRLVVRF